MKWVHTESNDQCRYIDLLMFKKRSVVELSYELGSYCNMPSILIQIGGDDLMFLTIGLIKFNLSLSLWTKHFNFVP